VGCGASLRVSSVHERGCGNWLAGSGGGDGAVRSREMLASATVLEIDPTQVWVVDHPELQVRLQRSAGRMMDTKCAGTSVGWRTTRAAHVHSIVQDGMRAVWPAEVVRRLVAEKVTSTDAQMVRVSAANLREGTGRACRDGDMHLA